MDKRLARSNSWKNNRKYQCKSIHHKIIPPQEVPLVGMSLRYIKKDNPHALWYQSEVYRVIEVGTFWFGSSYGVFLTNAYYPETNDIDDSTFIDMEDLWKWFEHA